METFKDIPGREGKYQASNTGTIKTLNYKRTSKERIIKGGMCRGYRHICLCKDGKEYWYYIARLVAQTFISNPENKPEVNHKDGNPLNNNVDNLEWATSSENNLHKCRILGYKTPFELNNPNKGKFGKNCHHCREVLQYSKDNILIKKWGSIVDAARKFGLHRTSITAVCKGRGKTAGGYKRSYL